jgi:hypothetical protein
MPTRAQRECRGITPPILDSGVRGWWAPPRPGRFSPGKGTFEKRTSLLALAEKSRDRTPGQFSDAFAKLREATISFVMSVCLSVSLSVRLVVRPFIRVEHVSSNWTNFDVLVFFENYHKNSNFMKICQE